MFCLVTNRRIKCSMFQTHAMTPFGVRKKKMFLSPRRSSLVRLFLWGVGGMTASGLTRLHFVPQHTSINSEYYINSILKKELKPVYDILDTSGTISKRRLFTDNAVSVFQQDGARAHTSAVSRAWLNENIPNYIENWPPNSPDLSPIENLWSIILPSSVYKDPEPKTPAQLKRRLRKAW